VQRSAAGTKPTLPFYDILVFMTKKKTIPLCCKVPIIEAKE